MQIALLADIHGNSQALIAVLNDIQKLSIDKLLVAGDFIGYYYHPGEVIDLLKEYDPVVIKGNHEIYLEEFHTYDSLKKQLIRTKYGSGLERAYDELTEKQKIWLLGLKENVSMVIDDKSLLLCHGSPWDVNEYIYPDSPEKIWEKFNSIENEIIIMGHTHYPSYKNIFGKIIVNPGSVGQPRNGTQGANWALLDTDTLNVGIHDSIYDVESVLNEAKSIDPDVPYLSEVLVREKKVK